MKSTLFKKVLKKHTLTVNCNYYDTIERLSQSVSYSGQDSLGNDLYFWCNKKGELAVLALCSGLHNSSYNRSYILEGRITVVDGKTTFELYQIYKPFAKYINFFGIVVYLVWLVGMFFVSLFTHQFNLLVAVGLICFAIFPIKLIVSAIDEKYNTAIDFERMIDVVKERIKFVERYKE